MKFPSVKQFKPTIKQLEKINAAVNLREHRVNKQSESAKPKKCPLLIHNRLVLFVVRSRAERTLPLFEYWMNISFDGASHFHSCTLRAHIWCWSRSSNSSSSSSSSNSNRCNTNALCFPPNRAHHEQHRVSVQRKKERPSERANGRTMNGVHTRASPSIPSYWNE